ncbi:MAG: hypothetical protein E7257_03380 [Lachnospiraceae bacterium]|nr:hypothetical protein [Lachnospiraceae bacterium]
MNNIYDRCPNCMNPYDGSGQLCPYCGQDVMGYVAPKTCLPPFTILQNKYMIGRVLGQGGFGITYIGYDMNLATYVAIKEFYPEVIATRGLAGNALMVTAQSGKDEIYNKTLDKFVVEARNLSKFYGLPGIVSVRNFFYENGTAYIVMDFVAGDNLKKYLADNGGRVDEATVLGLMKPVLESLYEIHKKGLIHRDISPDNIMFDDDGTIKLIDFGAVRGSSAETEMTYTVMLKHGYAPQEQYYAKGNQGPWTDIYSLCATMYKMLTGAVPPNCIERISEDTYIPPSQCGITVSPRVDQALTKGLSVNIADRYQNIGELIKDLYGKDYTFMGDGQIGVKDTAQPVASNEAQGSKVNNKKLIGIVAGAVAALLVIVLCVKVFVLSSKKDKITTTESTTEIATPTDISTTEALDTEPEYVFGGDWKDFSFMIDDVCYELPMTYEEWTSHGWTFDMERTLQPGDIIGVRCHKGNVECAVTLANYGLKTIGVEGCYVIGFAYNENYFHNEKNESQVILPKDVKISMKSHANSIRIKDVYEIYGEPSVKAENGFETICQYTSDDGGYLIFRADENGSLYGVEYASLVTPKGTVLNSYASTETLQYIEENEYPQATADRFDDVFCIDGVNYKLWGPVSQYLDNGWTIECSSETLEPNYGDSATLRKGEATIKVYLINATIFNLDINQTKVSKIEFDINKCQGIDIILPGGVVFGDKASYIEDLYSDISGYKELNAAGILTQYLYEYGVADGSISISVDSMESETEENVYYITGYAYERTYSPGRADLDNVDYIQGITVDKY